MHKSKNPVLRTGFFSRELVPKRRLELLQAYAHQTLNLARLPLPPLRLILKVFVIIRGRCQGVIGFSADFSAAESSTAILSIASCKA